MNDEPGQLEAQRQGESGPATAGELLALHDEADGLRHFPSAVGLPGLALFLALFLFVSNAADLGFIATLKVSLLVASPGLVLITRDMIRARRLKRLEQRIEELEQQRVTRRDDGLHLPSSLDAAEGGPRRGSA